jgi:hypothetical protein
MSFGRVFEGMIEVLHVKEMVRERMSGAAGLLESSVYDRSVLSLRQGELPSNATRSMGSLTDRCVGSFAAVRSGEKPSVMFCQRLPDNHSTFSF